MIAVGVAARKKFLLPCLFPFPGFVILPSLLLLSEDIGCAIWGIAGVALELAVLVASLYCYLLPLGLERAERQGMTTMPPLCGTGFGAFAWVCCCPIGCWCCRRVVSLRYWFGTDISVICCLFA